MEEGFEDEFLLEDAEVVDEAAGEAPAGQQGRGFESRRLFCPAGRAQAGGGGLTGAYRGLTVRARVCVWVCVHTGVLTVHAHDQYIPGR